MSQTLGAQTRPRCSISIPDPSPGQSMAYWGPDLSKMFGGIQPALSINFDANTNVDSLSFSYDGTLATQYFVTIIEPNTEFPDSRPAAEHRRLQGPPQTANAPTPLKQQPETRCQRRRSPTRRYGPRQAVRRPPTPSPAAASSTCCATGMCSRRGSSRQYAAQARTYDGKYYVKSVTHNIKRGEYKQNFTLGRGGTGSSVSTVSV